MVTKLKSRGEVIVVIVNQAFHQGLAVAPKASSVRLASASRSQKVPTAALSVRTSTAANRMTMALPSTLSSRVTASGRSCKGQVKGPLWHGGVTDGHGNSSSQKCCHYARTYLWIYCQCIADHCGLSFGCISDAARAGGGGGVCGKDSAVAARHLSDAPTARDSHHRVP